MKLNELKPVYPRKRNKRLGRGDASGHGGTSTKGHKGHKARSGFKQSRGFEGGQMPLARRLPKFGFVNPNAKNVGVVNVDRLNTLAKGTEVNLEFCKEKGWVSGRADFLKILAKGELKQSLQVTASAFSAEAKKKIIAAGGKVGEDGGSR